MVRILVVEDEGLFRDMLEISSSSLPNMEVVGAVSDSQAAIDAAEKWLLDVVLMDVDLGRDPNGNSAGRAIKQEHNEMGMIVLSAHEEKEYLNLVAKDEYSG